MRLGITIPFDRSNGVHFPELVRTADRCGYTDAWSYESFSSDAFTPIAAAAMLTERMRFGTRDRAGVHAAAGADCDVGGHHQRALGRPLHPGPRAFRRRISSSSGWACRFSKPVTQMRETVEALRAIFRGEKVTMAGKTVRINGFRLDSADHASAENLYWRAGRQDAAAGRRDRRRRDRQFHHARDVRADARPHARRDARGGQGSRGAGRRLPNNLSRWTRTKASRARCSGAR